MAGSVSKSGRAQTRKAAAGKGVTAKKAVEKKTTKKAASGKKKAPAKSAGGNKEGQPPITAESVRQAVQQVLGRILGRAAVPAKGPAGNGVPAKAGVAAKNKQPQGNGDPNARDRIDLLAPQDPRQAKLLRQARELAGSLNRGVIIVYINSDTWDFLRDPGIVRCWDPGRDPGILVSWSSF